MITVGHSFPAFKTKGYLGPGPDDFVEITHQNWPGKWTLYFFYPKDFSHVCPTEIADFGRNRRQFEDRDTVIVGGSTDNEFCHQAWCMSHEDLRDLKFPLINANLLAQDLGILDREEGTCLRATYIVDPHGIVQWTCVHNRSVGRNTREILRVLDAIQSDELCPCNWTPGETTLGKS